MRRNNLLAGVAGAIVGSWLTLIAVQFSGHGFSLPGRGSNVPVADNHPATSAASTPAATSKIDLAPPKNIEAPKPAETTRPDTAATGKPKPEEQTKTEPTKPAREATPDKAGPPAAEPASATTTPDSAIQPSDAAAMAAVTVPPIPAADSIDEAQTTEAAKAEDKTSVMPASATPQESKAATETAQTNNAPAKPVEAQPIQPAPAVLDAEKNTVAGPAEASKPIETAANKPAAVSTSSQPAPTDQAKADPLPDSRMPADQIDRQTAATEHRTLLEQPQPTLPQPQPNATSDQTSIDPAAKPDRQTTTVELVRPFAEQAGTLTVGGRSVQLDGIIPTDVERMCTGPSGKSWPCGQAARSAFRMYLRGRSIDCDVPDASWKGTVKAACRYVRVDLSAWLVRFGWADPQPGSPLEALVDEAKEKKRGMYGDDPRKNGKSTLAPALPKEDPLNPI
ncbi:hypothetical protein [Rhizobium lusitanum]|uniref:Endonuclease YncB(Thermonuclease family) n=1 Tax=Rhizobium lusitanum TaxID=293958 RepID=A0A7X0MGD5_9HYPH|nr:hypothetical protein [Rhizobium lusitanum]MBB6487958.1 endonuclease YncB(thermonuclease family) [Rhizobium lusitanum]